MNNKHVRTSDTEFKQYSNKDKLKRLLWMASQFIVKAKKNLPNLSNFHFGIYSFFLSFLEIISLL